MRFSRDVIEPSLRTYTGKFSSQTPARHQCYFLVDFRYTTHYICFFLYNTAYNVTSLGKAG